VPTRNNTTVTKKTPAVRKKRTRKKKAAPKKRAAKKASPKTIAGKQASVQTLTLDSVAVINNAKTLYQDFSQVADNADVNIDASAVEMIDTAILQLLFAFVMKVKASSHKVNWIKPSDEFISRATLLGLNQHMGIT